MTHASVFSGLSAVQGYTTDTNGTGQSTSNGSSGRERTEVDGERQDQSLVGVGRYGTNETITNSYQELLPENRWRAFPTVSPVYRGNDGIPFDVDCLTIPYLKSKKQKDHFIKWKKESLKAYGNAWCVQVGYEIMRAINELEKQEE